MEFHYITKGVCSRAIDFSIEDGILTSLYFTGGCSGNTQGIGQLAVGMKACDVVEKLRGIKCGFKDTSCPDQLAQAVSDAIVEAAQKEKS